MVKTIRKHIRFTSLIFFISILLQSCVLYNEGTYTLEQAAMTENRVKLKTTDNKILKYKKVEFTNGSYYGIKNTKDSDRILIKPDNIESVITEDKTMSTVLTIAIPIVVVGAIIVIASESTNDIGVGW